MAELADIVIDARHPASLARFWAAAIDGAEVAPHDADELARLASMGVLDTEDDPTVLVLVPHGPRLWVQHAAEPTPGKNRVHLDLRTADPDAESQRLTGLGARVVSTHDTHLVLADPEGNVFCLVQG